MAAIGVSAGYAVGGQAQVRLELAQGKLGERAEDAVDVAAGEAERGKRLLQLLHVMAVEVGHAQVQRAVAQAKRRIHQGSPGFLVHLVAALELRLGTEGGDGLRRFGPEQAVDAGLRPDSPMRERRCCTSSTAAPESLSLMVSIAPTYFSRFTNQSAMEISRFARQGRPHLFHQAALRGVGQVLGVSCAHTRCCPWPA